MWLPLGYADAGTPGSANVAAMLSKWDPRAGIETMDDS